MSGANATLETARKLRYSLKQLNVSYESIIIDNWDKFITAFKPPDNKQIGKIIR